MDETERAMQQFVGLSWTLVQVWVGDELGAWVYRFEVVTDDGRPIRTVGVTPADAINKAADKAFAPDAAAPDEA